MGVDVVTGGAGFIGSHLVHQLVALGRNVRVIDDLSTGNLGRLADVVSRIELARADLASVDIEPLIDGAERIFHLAAVPSVPRSVNDPLTTHRSVATATVRLLDAARRASVRAVVVSSSSSVYGEQSVSPKGEDLPPRPMSPYAVAKAAAERYTTVFADLYGLPAVALRYFNVFGPGQDTASGYAAVIPLFITRALAGQTLHVNGDGRQTRDFTFVDDVVEANIAAAGRMVHRGAVYNIAAGVPRSVRDLIAALELILGDPLSVDHGPARPGDILHSAADIGLARRELGWGPRTTFEEGLRRTVEWYRQR